jgi:hypothetical protein
VITTRQLQAAEVLSKLSTMSDKSSFVKGIVSPDWTGLQMVSLDRFEV